jgi:hypothetical protein
VQQAAEGLSRRRKTASACGDGRANTGHRLRSKNKDIGGGHHG